jgi:hypothetical protein
MNKLSEAYIQGFREELEKIGLLGTALKWAWRLSNPVGMATWLAPKAAKMGLKAGIKTTGFGMSTLGEAVGGKGLGKAVGKVYDVAAKAPDYLI